MVWEPQPFEWGFGCVIVFIVLLYYYRIRRDTKRNSSPDMQSRNECMLRIQGLGFRALGLRLGLAFDLR